MHFVHKHAKRLGREVDSVSSRTLRELTAYSWPGNVRELENVIQRALITSTGPVLDFFDPSRAAPTAALEVADTAALDGVERSHIVRVLAKTDWVIEGSAGAAALLKVPPSTLRSKMKRLGIARPA